LAPKAGGKKEGKVAKGRMQNREKDQGLDSERGGGRSNGSYVTRKGWKNKRRRAQSRAEGKSKGSQREKRTGKVARPQTKEVEENKKKKGRTGVIFKKSAAVAKNE